MYFFSEEERKYLLKKLIPKTREKGIARILEAGTGIPRNSRRLMT